jgi:hypothetical protein
MFELCSAVLLLFVETCPPTTYHKTMKTGTEDARVPVWLRNEDVGIRIVKCSQREVRVSCLRLCRSMAIDGEKETRHNLKHATRDQTQDTRRHGLKVH